jgi:hypothetical protein
MNFICTRKPGFAILLWPLLAVSGLWPVSANGASSGCEEQNFQSYQMEDGKRVFNDEKFRVFSKRMKVPVYKNSSGAERTRQVLDFGQKFFVSDPGSGFQRMRVRKLSDEDVGWIERDDLLCRLYPTADAKTGLLRRVVIQTETAEQGKVVPRTAYHSPDKQCEGGDSSCPKLSRFHWYFVYAQENGYVLLSEAANLGRPDARLVGWLPENDGINWNTAIALRPTEELARRKAANGSEAHVCAFPSLDTMKDPKACRPVLGGKRWFKIDSRLPVLREVDNVYEVAISSAATSGSFDEALSLAGVDALKNIDVFFVIDGTKSMKSIIDAIKGRPGFPGVVDQILTRMKGKIKEGATLRYGYRIYRDSVKGGTTGVEDEGLPLTDNCGPNENDFAKSFKSVHADDITDDKDFSENVYGGLIQASRDFSSCPDHLKLIFVIGDAGYDADAQRQRGQKVFDIESVVQRYVSGRRLNTQPIVLFIRGPNEIDGVTGKEAYQKAYDDFRSQGVAILKGVYGSIASAGIKVSVNPEDYFFTLQSRQADTVMIDRIIQRVDDWLQPETIGKLATRLRSGESLADAITALQRGDSANVPVLYWSVIADALCKRLGSQCNKQILEGVFRAFIARNDDLTLEVLLSQGQLENWREVLGKFKTFWSTLRSGERSRGQVVNVLTESIGSVLKLDIDDSGKSIGEFVQFAGGLPNGAASKLMAYTPAELRDENVIDKCEIQHLVNYAGKKADIIQIVLDGDKLAIFASEVLPISACPTLTAKGKAVPHLSGAPLPRPLNEDTNTNYSFRFTKGNDRYYWIPLGYLP